MSQRQRARAGQSATAAGRDRSPNQGAVASDVATQASPALSSTGWRRMLSHIEATNGRGHIERALRTYLDSWATGDIEGRLALFGEDVVIEDPATVRRAVGTAELREYLMAEIPSTWSLTFSFERIAVVADEAILTYRITLRSGRAQPADLLVNAHAEFGPDGLIHRFRTFFDTEAITDHALNI
jgi:steroid Delta-isomerase